MQVTAKQENFDTLLSVREVNGKMVYVPISHYVYTALSQLEETRQQNERYKTKYNDYVGYGTERANVTERGFALERLVGQLLKDKKKTVLQKITSMEVCSENKIQTSCIRGKLRLF